MNIKKSIKGFPPGPDKDEERIYKSVEPFSITDALKIKGDKLSISSSYGQLKREGYCVIEHVFNDDITSLLTETIYSLAQETEGYFKGLSAPLLLGRHKIFEEIVTNESLLTIVQFSVGKGALLSQLIGGIRPEGANAFNLHIDSAWTPSPLPHHPLFITACVPCSEDFTLSGGCTKVVPGSHMLRRQPFPEEIIEEKDVIPIECGKGSLVFWTGSTWHGNYLRQDKGDRVVLHISFSRLMMRTIENYDHLDDEWLKNKPHELRIMLGREDFLGTTSIARGGVDRAKTTKTFNWSQS